MELSESHYVAIRRLGSKSSALLSHGLRNPERSRQSGTSARTVQRRTACAPKGVLHKGTEGHESIKISHSGSKVQSCSVGVFGLCSFRGPYCGLRSSFRDAHLSDRLRVLGFENAEDACHAWQDTILGSIWLNCRSALLFVGMLQLLYRGGCS